jgi:hypothetical protein
VILQGFDAKKITGGASGALRQEFRELELLDDIGRLRYIGELPVSVVGDRRNTLIHAFRKCKGEQYVPENVHKAIQWSKNAPFVLNSDYDDVLWHVLDKKTSLLAVQSAVYNAKLLPAFKRKIENIQNIETVSVKKMKSGHGFDISSSISLCVPEGTSWRNNSCAYDATNCILHDIWKDDKIKYCKYFEDLNSQFLGCLANSFTKHAAGEYSLEEVRDYLRRHLRRAAPQTFPWGGRTSVQSLLDYMFATTTPIISSSLSCINNHSIDQTRYSFINNCHINIAANGLTSIQEHIDYFQITSASVCTVCNSSLMRTFEFIHNPPLLAFDVSAGLTINHLLEIPVDGEICTYDLRGIIYHGDDHFTARVVTCSQMVWFHDGLITKSSMEYDGLLSAFNESADLTSCRTKIAVAAIYILRI